MLPLILCGVWFFVLEQVVRSPKHFMYTRFDDWIPFVPGFVIPYVVWYAYVIVTSVYLFFRSREAFRKIAIFLSAGMCFACIVYTMFPNGQFLRPMTLGDGWCSRLIANLYRNDTPFNSAPSIHVIYAIGTALAILEHSRNVRRNWYIAIAWATWTMTVLICLSTVFIKQHSVIDLVSGLGVSFMLYWFIYKEPGCFLFRATQEAQE